MAKADRLEQMDERRVELEAEYHAILIVALRKAAAGEWGLFGHNSDRRTRAAAAPTLGALDEAAKAIHAIRARFDMGPFALHSEFISSRGPVGPNAPGEPKQALLWLNRLGASAE